MRFEFATAGRIVFGPGTVKDLPAAARSIGSRALLVLGMSGRGAAAWTEQLHSQGIDASELRMPGEPTVDLVLSGLDQARDAKCDLVIAIGGGSVIDSGKAIAALLGNPGTAYDYLEVVGQGKPLTNPSVPCIAVPTTAGTGSEVTRNAVLLVTERHVKVSLRGPAVLPRLAMVDPELTYSLPPSVTATSGLDALTQLIEPFLSNAANPMTDAVCRDGIQRAARSLKRAYEHGDDQAAREDMSLASLFSGMALANARLGAAHGFAGPIGGAYPAPHGAVCARLLPLAMQANLHGLQDRAPASPILQRFGELAQLLTGDMGASAEAGIEWVRDLCALLQVPPLSSYGMSRAGMPEIIAAAKKSSSMKGNPIELTDDELRGIMEAAL